MEMNADSKRKPRQRDSILAERARRRQEEALDDALKNTFPASDPVSNPLRLPRITIERMAANGSTSALGHEWTCKRSGEYSLLS